MSELGDVIKHLEEHLTRNKAKAIIPVSHSGLALVVAAAKQRTKTKGFVFQHPYKFEEGQRVVKKSGYPFPGIVVVRFLTLKDTFERYVVDFTDANGDPTGLMHIFSWDQLEAAP